MIFSRAVIQSDCRVRIVKWSQQVRNGIASTEMEDGQLLQGVARGEQDALLTLHKRYVNLVYSMAWRVLQDVGLAEEVTQDIFLKLWHKSHQYDPARGRFSSWLLSVTRFAAIDRLRREGPAAGSGRTWRRATRTRRWPSNNLTPTDHAAWERGQHLRLVLAAVAFRATTGYRAGVFRRPDAFRAGRAPGVTAGYGERPSPFGTGKAAGFVAGGGGTEK